MRCRSCYCDVSDDSKRIELSPCGCRYCYKCMIRQQVASTADESNFGRGMECQCGVHVQKHLWYPAVDDSDADDFEPEEMEHPKLDEDYDAFRLWCQSVKGRVDQLGSKEVFGTSAHPTTAPTPKDVTASAVGGVVFFAKIWHKRPENWTRGTRSFLPNFGYSPHQRVP